MLREEVRSIAAKYLDSVRPSGPDNIMAICPFHRHIDGSPERTPSFAMSLVTGLYICHSCKETGNLRQFLRALGVSLTTIDKQYGLVLDALATSTPAKKPLLQLPSNSIEPLPESLLGLFDYMPLYLIEKGFTASTLRAFDVGMDMKHMRVTFPLRDVKGRLIGISGRTLTNDRRRYKVYDVEYVQWGLPIRSTSLFGVLWNVDRLYSELFFGSGSYVVVVEGYKACMWVHQAGIRNVVSTCGSHLNDGQLWILEHLGVPVYMMFDNDNAGQEGQEKAVNVLRKSLPVHVVSYDAKQPDGLSPTAVTEAISNAKDAHKWILTTKGKINRWHMEKHQ